MVKEVTKMEKMLIRGVTKDSNVARLSVLRLEDKPGIAFNLFSKLAAKKINVDIILQSSGRRGTKDITFTVAEDNAELARDCIMECFPEIEEDNVIVDKSIAKVSIVGAGMETHPGTASRMFDALYSAGINIEMISTSEIKISVLVDQEMADRAVDGRPRRFRRPRRVLPGRQRVLSVIEVRCSAAILARQPNPTPLRSGTPGQNGGPSQLTPKKAL